MEATTPACYNAAQNPPDGFVHFTDITKLAHLFGQRCTPCMVTQARALAFPDNIRQCVRAA